MSRPQPTDDETARTEAEAIAREAQAWRRCGRAGIAGCLAFLVALVISVYSLQPGHEPAAATSGAFALAALAWGGASGRRCRVLAKRLLAHPYATFEQMTALLEGTAGLTPPPEVTALIARLLDETAPEQFDRLSSRHVDVLHSYIAVDHGEGPSPVYGGGPGNTLKLAALRVLGNVGNAATVSAVDELLKAERSIEIQAAAWECREILEHRLSRRDPSGTLLRPTEAPGEALLRPAEAGAGEETLLRPAEDGE